MKYNHDSDNYQRVTREILGINMNRRYNYLLAKQMGINEPEPDMLAVTEDAITFAVLHNLSYLAVTKEDYPELFI